MRTSHAPLSFLLGLCAAALLGATALAADPGTPAPTSSVISDQKPGSVLFYNVYTSNATAPATQNSRINLTNTSQTSAAFVHLFFVDGSTCSVADSFICLTANQTASLLASDLDPGVTGYLVAIAVDGILGCPISFNFLIGDLYAKFATGHAGNLGAEAFAAVLDQFIGCGPNATVATLFFDQAGISDCYNQIPRVLAVDDIPARADGNDTLLIINRVGGSLVGTASSIGGIFGLLYDDAENTYSFTFTAGVCQFRSTISNTFPRTVPRVETVIPAGRSGWMKFWAINEQVGLLGAVFNFNARAGTSTGFSGARNLHKLTTNNFGTGTVAAPSLTIPVLAPSC